MHKSVNHNEKVAGVTENTPTERDEDDEDEAYMDMGDIYGRKSTI